MPSPIQSLRQLFEKLAYAGLKPDAPAAPKKSKLQSLIDSAGELATAGLRPDEAPLPGPTSWKKKAGVVVALLAIGAGVYGLVWVLQNHAEKPESQTTAGPPPPIVPPGLKVEKNNFNKAKQPKEITGTVRNLSGRQVATASISFDVTTKDGSQLGGVATTVHDLKPHGTAQFRILVPQQDAAFAMVRELRTE
jgi:hypothetical protein